MLLVGLGTAASGVTEQPHSPLDPSAAVVAKAARPATS
jgi:hypothetical protein